MYPRPPPLLLILTLKTNSSRINPDNIKSGATIRAVSMDYHAEPPGLLSGTETGASSLQKCSSIFSCIWPLVSERWSSFLLVYSSKSQLGEAFSLKCTDKVEKVGMRTL